MIIPNVFPYPEDKRRDAENLVFNKLKEILTGGQKVVENTVIFCAPKKDELDKVAKANPVRLDMFDA